MGISPKYLGGLILTNSAQDVVTASTGQTVRITSIFVSNGGTGGTLTLEFFDSSESETRILENATDLTANERYKSSEQIYLEEGDKLIASAGTTTDAEISVFGLISPSVILDRSGHILQDEGSDLPQKTYLNFIGSLVNAVDNTTSTDITVDFLSSEITGKPTVTGASGDFVLATDASDSDNLKKIDIDAFLITELSTDTTPQLGGNLDVNNFSLVDSNNNELLKFSSTASAVNDITITNNSTTNNPKISASGSDTNIGLELEAKGTGIIKTNSILTCDKPVAIKIDSGSTTSLDCSLYNGFVRNINSNTTFTFANTSAIPSGYQVDFLIHINYTSGTVGLPSGTYINGTSAPTFSAGNSYEVVFRTFDGGATFYILGV
jgi:hypothetical protein